MATNSILTNRPVGMLWRQVGRRVRGSGAAFSDRLVGLYSYSIDLIDLVGLVAMAPAPPRGPRPRPRPRPVP